MLHQTAIPQRVRPEVRVGGFRVTEGKLRSKCIKREANVGCMHALLMLEQT
jgi:hypothetical protein